MRLLSDLIVVYSIVVIALAWGYFGFFAPFGNYLGLVFTLAIFGAPSAYLLYRDPSNIKNALIAGGLIGILFGFPFDFVATYSNAWIISPDVILFPGALFGVVHIDELVWFFLWAVFVVAFYEHFIEHHKRWFVSPRVKYGVAIGVCSSILVTIAFFVNPNLLRISYAYLVLGACAAAPLILLIIRPHLTRKIILTSAFFAPIYLGFDLVALANGWWAFDGQYIGGVTVLGELLPWEEIIIWIILGGGIIALYDELFLDDCK